MRKLVLLPFLLFSCLSLAHATILGSCSELMGIGCTQNGYILSTTNTGRFDATYSRSGMQMPSTTFTTSPLSSGIYLAFSSASSSFWTSGQAFLPAWNSTVNRILMEWQDGSTVRLVLRATTVSGELKFSSRDNAGTMTDLVTFASGLCCSTRHKIDIFINYGTEITMYLDGSQVGQYLGDPRTNGATTLSQVNYGGSLSLGSSGTWTELYVADEDTRNFRLWTASANAAGTVQDWLNGAAASKINGALQTDGTSNGTFYSNKESNWTLSTGPSAYYAVKDVASCTRMSRNTALSDRPQNFRFSAYVNGTSYYSPSDINPGDRYSTSCYDWNVNPASSSPWTKSTLTGSQFGVISKP